MKTPSLRRPLSALLALAVTAVCLVYALPASAAELAPVVSVAEPGPAPFIAMEVVEIGLGGILLLSGATYLVILFRAHRAKDAKV